MRRHIADSTCPAMDTEILGRPILLYTALVGELNADRLRLIAPIQQTDHTPARKVHNTQAQGGILEPRSRFCRRQELLQHSHPIGRHLGQVVSGEDQPARRVYRRRME